MPKIPTHTSEKQLTTEAPNVFVDPSAFASTGRMLQQQVAPLMEDVAQKFVKLRDVQQITEAHTEASTRMDKVQQDIAVDPDIWGAGDKAAKEIEKIKSDVFQKISSPEARMQFESEFTIQSSTALAKINRDLRNRQVDTAKASLIQATDNDREAYFNAASPLEQLSIKQRMKDRIDTFKAAGALEAENALNYWKETEHDLNIGQVKSDISIDADFALQQLQKGKEGSYPDLTHEERLDLIDRATRQSERNKKIANQNVAIAQNKAESDTLDAYWKGELTTKSLEESHLAGQISNKFFDHMMKTLTSPKAISAKTDPETYMRMVDLVMSPNRKAGDVRNELLKEVASGKLATQDMKTLYTTKMIPGDKGQFSLAEEVSDENAPPPESWQWLKTSIDFIKKVSPGYNLYQLTSRWLNKVNQNQLKGPEVLAEAKKEVQRSTLETNPAIANFQAEGQLMIDAFGNQAMVYPDGRIEEIEAVEQQTEDNEENE